MSFLSSYDFSGKTALITGASSGLGERFARCLSIHGCRVLLASQSTNKLNVLADELGNSIALTMDVSNKESIH